MQQRHRYSLSDTNNNAKNANNPKDGNQRPHPSSSARRIEEEYDLRDLLGTGTCGEVRRAIHRRTGEERAVKIISINGGRGGKRPPPAGGGGSNMIMSSENLTAIQAEAEILRSLDHPYVVKLYDTFISPSRGTIYLVMELIRGGDLFDRIVDKRDGRYTEVQARRLLRRILTAVHYLHEDCGIVHRDLKPENILVVDRRSDVNIKLTDFGLAKNMTSEGLKTFCGTPQ
jgi:serine/threonine protein kinase